MTSMPLSHTSQPSPQAPSVGDSQLSSTKRTSCTSVSKPSARNDAEIQIEDLQRRGFDDHLELVVVLQAERVVAVAAIGGTARGLHVRRRPRLGADGAQKRRGVKRAGAHFHVVGLQDHAALVGPVFLQREDQVLEGAGRRAQRHVGEG